MKLSPKTIISGAIAAITLTTASITLNPSSAKAWPSLSIPLSLPSGIYANVQGKQFYLGDFSNRPDPQCPVTCSWAVRYNGNLSAHGNGRTPPWVMELIKRFGR